MGPPRGVNSLKSGVSIYSDCPVVGCLKLYLKTPDPPKKESVQSDHSEPRKRPKCGEIPIVLPGPGISEYS